MILGDLIYRITGDDSGLKKTLKNNDKKVKGFGKTLAAVGKIAAVAFVAKGIGIAVSKLIEFGAVAADAQEIESKFDAVFKDNADSVREWAEVYSESIGRNSNAQLGFLASVQDTLVPLGFMRDEASDVSKEVVTLANDLASFNNLPTEEVVAGITSALVGNTENLRRYGVVATEATIKQEALTAGIIKEGQALTAQQKAQSILNILTKSTTDAQGDLIRTKESAANVTKSLADAELGLQIALGEVVNKAMTPYRRAATDIINRLTELIEKGKETEEAYKAQAEGTATAEQNIIAYTAQLNIQRKALDAANALNQAGTEIITDRIANLEEMIKQERIHMQFQALDARSAAEAAAANAKRDAEEAARNEERKNDLAALDAAFSKTEESRIRALQAQIAYFESFKQEGRVIFILRDLRAELENLTDGAEEQAEFISNEGISAWDAYGTMVKVTLADEFEAEQALNAYRKTEHEEELQRIEDEKQARLDAYSQILSGAGALFTALGGLSQAQLQTELSNLDAQLQAALIAAGVQEETTLERINRELQAAIEAGDTEKQAELEIAKERAEITQQFEDKKALIQYKAQLQQWKFQKAAAIATGAQAILSGYATVPFLPAGLIAGTLATAMTGVQLSTIDASKPQPPQGFNKGGLVGGIGENDTIPAMLTPGEYVLTKDQVAQAIDSQVSGGGSVNVIFNNLLAMGKEAEFRQVARKLVPYIQAEQKRIGV